MSERDEPEVMWEGRYIRAMKLGRWEFTSRCKGMTAVVILAEHQGKVLLVEQERPAIGRRCIELPAGLVGDEDEAATVLGTAEKELLEETGFKAERFEELGEFYSSPGMIAESFTLVRATGLTKVTDGGGTEHEDIVVHHVTREDIPGFVERMRGEGKGIDVRLLLVLGASLA